MEIIHQPPHPSSLTPLAQHQSQTPHSFFSGPDVLYHHCPSASLVLHASDLLAAPALAGLVNGVPRGVNGGVRGDVNGDGDGDGGREEHDGEEEDEEEEEEIEVVGVLVWVTSERLILFSPSLTAGLAIPYPSISLHALQRPARNRPPSLFLQILAEAQTFDDHDPDSTFSMTVVPAAAAAAAAVAGDTNAEGEEEGERERGAPELVSQAQALFAALSACANLHPDPVSGEDGDGEEEGLGAAGHRPAIVFEGDGDGGGGGGYLVGEEGGAASGLPPPMPGSGGWITADNVGEVFDGEGNWRGWEGEGAEREGEGGSAGLGGGAGTVRGRGDEGDGVDGGGGEGADETKWRRTE